MTSDFIDSGLAGRTALGGFQAVAAGDLDEIEMIAEQLSKNTSKRRVWDHGAAASVRLLAQGCSG